MATIHLSFVMEVLMKRKVLVPVADGTEEIEAVCIIDVLRRAGTDVTVASVNNRQVTASRGVKLVADKLIAECRDETYDLIVLPGGIPGAENLRDSEPLTRLLKRQKDKDRWFGAICAAPAVVLEHHGLLKNHRATCHPAFAERLTHPDGTASRVVVDGRCVTSQGPGTALEFAVELVALLYGRQKAEEVAKPMIMNGH